MKIDSIYISSFGKFEDKKFDFSDGLNVIYGENEDGKTTLMTFIRMIFYGTGGKSTDELYFNPRKKYASFNDKPMAGSIDFTLSDTKYRIERIFKTSNATDKIAVINLSTGERETFSGKEDLGKRFLGLSAEAAERSIFLKENGALQSNTHAEGELNSRLSNLSSSLNENVSAEDVRSRIEKAKNLLITKTGRGGIITREKDNLDSLLLSLAESKKIEQERIECQLKLANTKERFNNVKTEIDRLSAQIKEAQGGKRYSKLKELCDCVKTIQSLDKKVVDANGNVVTLAQINDSEGLIKEYKILFDSLPAESAKNSILKGQLEKLREELNLTSGQEAEKLKNDIEQTEKVLKEKRKEIEEKNSLKDSLKEELLNASLSKPKIRPIFLIITIIGILIGASSFVFNSLFLPLLIGGGAIALSGFILTVFCRKKLFRSLEEISDDIKTAENLIYDLSLEEGSLSGVLQDLLSKEAARKEREAGAGQNFISKNEEYTESCNKLHTLTKRTGEIKDALSVYITNNAQFSAGGMEIVLFSLKSNLQKREAAQIRLSLLEKDLDGISYEDALRELSSIPEGAISVGDLDDLNERLIFKKNEYSSLLSAIADISAKARNDFKFHKHPEIITKEIEEKKELIEKEEAYHRSLEIALEVLGEAFVTLRENYGGDLTERTGEIFGALTSGRYKAVNISKSFDISVERSDIFGSHSWQSLSDGTIDQAYFALRLAISEHLSGEGERLPLILDDPFDRYDDTRAQKAMEFLEEYSKDSQTLLFTCHKVFAEERNPLALK